MVCLAIVYPPPALAATVLALGQPDSSQIPNLDPMATQETARVLAYISPAAAAQLGRPMPQLLPLTDLESMLQPCGMGAAAEDRQG